MSIDMEVTLPLYTETTYTEEACTEILKDTSNEISDEEHIKRLQIALKKKVEECRLLKKKLQRTNIQLQQKETHLQQGGTQFENIFTEDQRHFLVNRTQRGASWSDETITKTLKLCGLWKKKLSGVAPTTPTFPKYSVQTFNPEEKHAVLLIDEMSITAGLQYDHTIAAVVGRPIMKLSGGFDSTGQKATHALVFMLCGIATNWKQTIGYEFTANSFCSRQMVQTITQIITKMNDIGITIKVETIKHYSW